MAVRSALEISREVAALAQAGLAYTQDAFDRERFQRLNELAGEMLRVSTGAVDFAWPVELGYPTPKVDVRAVVFHEGKVLLVREASSGKWALPGGWADVNVSPAENAEKECLEESGFVVKARRLTSFVDRDRAGYPPNPHAIYKVYFLCELLGGAAVTSIESTAVDFFALDALPEIDTHRIQVTEIFEAWRQSQDASAPAVFN